MPHIWAQFFEVPQYILPEKPDVISALNPQQCNKHSNIFHVREVVGMKSQIQNNSVYVVTSCLIDCHQECKVKWKTSQTSAVAMGERKLPVV